MKKLLIVDNSNLIINVLKDLFAQRNDFEIFVAKSLSQVQTLLKEQEFFIAVSNVVLPDALNGELLDILGNKKIPTIVLSSSIDDDFLQKIEKYPIIDYVLKDSITGLDTVYHIAQLMLFIKNEEVLVVEDSANFALQLQEILESLLLKVIVVPNGKEAINILESNKKISMVITDLNMPQMNGLDLAKAIRKEKTQIELPIIAMSSNINKKEKIKLFKHGVNDFLDKPILKDELKSKIIDAFSGIRKVKEIKTLNSIFDEHIIASGTNEKGVIKWVSQAFCEISGYSKDELIGKQHNIVRHPEMPKTLYVEMWKTIQSGNCWKGEIKNLRKDGTSYWVSAAIEPQYDSTGEISGFTAVRQDITDKKRIYELSITDSLTGLYNRRFFNEVANEQMHKTIRSTNIFAFILLDIDNFKKYNDTYGHQEGDNVLKKVAKSLQNSFKRNDDFVFRLGGEEFGVIIHTKSKEDTQIMVENARKNIQSLNIKHEKNPSSCVTASFGMVVISSENSEYKIDNIYKLADDCLYKAKEEGRNRVILEYLD